MKREEILKTIDELSFSQGMYGRLKENLLSDPEYKEEFLAEAEKQNFKDVVDFVMWYEG